MGAYSSLMRAGLMPSWLARLRISEYIEKEALSVIYTTRVVGVKAGTVVVVASVVVWLGSAVVCVSTIEVDVVVVLSVVDVVPRVVDVRVIVVP